MTQHDAAAIHPSFDANFTSWPDIAAFEAALVRSIGTQRYQMWFQGRSRLAFVDGRLIVGVPNLHFQQWIQKNFAAAIRDALADIAMEAVEIVYQVDPDLFRELKTEQAASQTPAPAPAASEPTQRDLFGHLTNGPKVPPRSPRRRWRTLGHFVIGQCNRVAFAAATSVIEEPGQGPNPLVLHGPVGTGKTHLLEGIYVGLRRTRPDLKVQFVAAEDFTNRFISSMRFGKQHTFRKQFRSCDVLLLDDLHFLARKRATQEEFLHTFDALLTDGAQVVLTSDCHPRLNDDFMPELMDRLLGGSIWGLQPPDTSTRVDLLRSKAMAEHLMLPDEVIEYLGDRLRGNVRELEGAMHTLRHYSQVARRPVDLDLTHQALGDLLRHAVRVVRLEDVDNAVCRALRLPAGSLQGKDRTWSVSHPRMAAIFLCRKHTAASYSEISKHFGGKSHTTAVAAEKRVRQWLASSERIAAAGQEWPIGDLLERIERELLG